jgi:hypothetical protein
MRKVKIEPCGNEDILLLLSNCPALQSLTVCCSGKLNGKYENHLMPSAFEAISSSYANGLEEFHYERSLIDGNNIQYCVQSAAALVQMLHRCSQLKKVSLTGSVLRGMRLDELQPFGHLCYELGLGFENTFPTHDLSGLLSHCCNLRKFDYFGKGRHIFGIIVDPELELFGIEQDRLVLTALYQSCPLLEDLELQNLSAVALDGALSGLRRSCIFLRKLTICSCKLSALSLREVALCSSLRSLSCRWCKGLTDAGVASLAVLQLTNLLIKQDGFQPDWDDATMEAALVSFAGANISHTLDTLWIDIEPHRAVDADMLATALASCDRLTRLHVKWGNGGGAGYAFGLDALQAIATGCPLLATVELPLALPGCEYVATHCSHLTKCKSSLKKVISRARSELQAKYPNVDWSCERAYERFYDHL